MQRWHVREHQIRGVDNVIWLVLDTGVSSATSKAIRVFHQLWLECWLCCGGRRRQTGRSATTWVKKTRDTNVLSLCAGLFDGLRCWWIVRWRKTLSPKIRSTILPYEFKPRFKSTLWAIKDYDPLNTQTHFGKWWLTCVQFGLKWSWNSIDCEWTRKLHNI